MHRAAGVHCVGSDSAHGRQDILDAMVELSIQSALEFLSPFAICNIDVDANHPMRTTVAVIRREATCLNPANLTPRSNDTIVDHIFPQSIGQVTSPDVNESAPVFRMKADSPGAARNDAGTFRQTVQCCLPNRDLPDIGAALKCGTSIQSGPLREGKLQGTLGQRQFRLFALG